MSNLHTFGKASIDSLKFTIPFEYVKVLDTTLFANNRNVFECIPNKDGLLHYEDLEWVKEYKETSRVVSTPDLTDSFRIMKVSRKCLQTKEFVTELVVTLKSSLLGTEYFDGLTFNNKLLVYSKIMGAGLFKIDFEDWLNESRICDMDIKVDIQATKDQQIDFNKELYELALASKDMGMGAIIHSKTKNIQFNNRNSGKLKTPFLKCYDKSQQILMEIDKHRKEQTKLNRDLTPTIWELNHLETITDTLRIEATIPTTPDIIKFFKLKDASLNSVLSLTPEHLFTYIQHSINSNIKPPPQTPPPPMHTCKTKTPDPIERILINSIAVSMQNEKRDITSWIEFQQTTFETDLNNQIYSKLQRSRAKKKMKGILFQALELYNNSKSLPKGSYLNKMNKTNELLILLGIREQKLTDFNNMN